MGLIRQDAGDSIGIYRYLMIIGSGIVLSLLLVGTVLHRHQQALADSSDWVTHTYKVMNTARDFAANLQRMVVAERGYLLNGSLEFQSSYRRYETESHQLLGELEALTRDNAFYRERIPQLRETVEDLEKLLDAERKRAMPLIEAGKPGAIDPKGNQLNLDIQDQIDAMMREEDRLLYQRLRQERITQKAYNQAFFVGIIGTALVILLLNLLVMRLLVRKDKAERDAVKLNERFALAMRATSDGIFDWDMTTGDVYYSPRFKQMLGYREDELSDSRDAVEQLIHPDDLPRVLQYLQDYLDGRMSEFNAVYRIRHKTGGYLWLHARGRATFGPDKKPIRMVGATADITSFKAIEERLRIEKELAVSANKAKTDFLTNMSHEIRTPLNAIVGISSIMSRKMVKNKEQEEQLISTLQHSSVALMDLVNDVLDLAKIENNEMDLDYRPFALGKLLQQITSMMSVRAIERGLKFEMDPGEFENSVYVGDEGRVRQVLINLVGNAIKFTEKGVVSLELTRDNGELRFDVRDTGIGIREDDIEKIFNKFEQVDNSTTRKYGGTGLGLAISQRLASMMGGRIEARSTPGKGSTFSLLIPDNTDASASHEPPPPPPPTFPPLRQPHEVMARVGEKRILIAEDFENNLLVIKFFMEALDIPYDIAHNGVEAVELYKKYHHPFVLMDVQMPNMDGLDATRAIREYEKEEGLPPSSIVAMTAHAMAGDSARCIDAGMNDYLSKPLLESDIRQKLKLYLDPLGAAG